MRSRATREDHTSDSTAFGRLLYECIYDLDMAVSDFALLTEVSSGFLSAVYRGKKRPPLSRLEEWCTILHLTGADRQRFLLAAYATHAPPGLVWFINRLLEQPNVSHRLLLVAEEAFDPGQRL